MKKLKFLFFLKNKLLAISLNNQNRSIKKQY